MKAHGVDSMKEYWMLSSLGKLFVITDCFGDYITDYIFHYVKMYRANDKFWDY